MAHTAGWPSLKNSNFILQFPIYDADGDLVAGATGLDSEVSKDGGTYTDCTNEAAEIATSSGTYALELEAAEMNADRVMVITKSSGKTAVNQLYPEVRQIHDLAFPTTSGRSIDVTTTGEVGLDLDNTSGTLAAAQIATDAITAAKIAAGAIDAATFAAGAIDATAIANAAIDAATFAVGAIDASAIATGAIDADAIAADAITAAKIAASAIGATEIATGAIDADAIAADAITAAKIATDAITSDELATSAVTEIRSLVNGTADSGSTTTMVDAARTEADTDYWKGCWILFTSGTLANQARLITAFTPGTDTITFSPATTQAVSTHTYEILAAGAQDVRLWAGSAPNALQTGRVDSYTGAMAANVVDSSAIATGAIDADAIAADAIGASEIANGAIDAATFAAGAIDASAIANGAIDAATFAAGAIDASAIANAAIDAATFAAGAIDASAIAADAITSSELATTAVNEIRDAILSDSTAFPGASVTEARLSELDQGTAGKMANEVDIIKAGTISITGTVSDASPAATDFDTSLTEASDDHYNTHWLIFTNNNLIGQARMIQNYTGASKNCAFDRAFTEAPANGDAFTILAAPSSAWDVLLARLADVEGEASVSNRMALWAIAKLVNKVDASTTTVAIKKTDDTSNLFTQTATENASANPIEVLDTN